MRKHGQTLFFIVFCCLVLTGGAFYFLENYELKNSTEYTGFKGEAKENDLFAARLLLRRMGIDAQRAEGLPALDSKHKVIILDTRRYNLTQTQIDRLLEWVQQGGHLITVARVDGDEGLLDQLRDEDKPDTASRDHLQNQLGIYTGEHQFIEDEKLPFMIHWNKAPTPLKLHLDFFHELGSSNKEARKHQAGGKTWLIQQDYGEGLISLASHLDFINNYALDQADHAHLLWYLLHDHSDNKQDDIQTVWLIHHDQRTSIFQVLWQYAFPVLVLLALGVLLFFWAKIPRFGALIPSPVAERRRITDHIHASGRFYWKQQKHNESNKQSNPLLTTTRHTIEQAARRHIPGWDLLPEGQRMEDLQNFLGSAHSKETLHELMSSSHLKDQQFIELVKLAHALRNTA